MEQARAAGYKHKINLKPTSTRCQWIEVDSSVMLLPQSAPRKVRPMNCWLNSGATTTDWT